MEKKQKILECRKKLDDALSLPDLVNEDFIATLVKEQLIQFSLRNNKENVDKIVKNRTVEVANFLEMLRSASGTSNSHLKLQKDWKVKQDTDQLRVMYCEGPHGSPFHTLLAEGFADGPMDVCFCVSWESTLYKKWWPQYNVPTFKIIVSQCLQKVRIGEEISLIRVKVPWPVSDREAVLHYFEIEYFKEDLILVLIKTISHSEDIDADTHGFSGDVIPQAKDTIRMDLVGGCVLQKVDSNRCYFRAIFNFDIKLEFIPASLINFISRQLIGNGHKLYQKAVGSVATIDKDYQLALQGPLYVRIRQQLRKDGRPATSLEGPEKENPVFLNIHKVDASAKDNAIKTSTSISEITEEDTEKRAKAVGNNHYVSASSGNLVADKERISSEERPSISPEVEQALDILDQVISLVRGQSIGGKSRGKPSLVIDDFPTSEQVAKTSLFNNGFVSESSNSNIKLNKSEGSPDIDYHRKNNMSSSIIEEAGHNHEVILPQKDRFSDLDGDSKTKELKFSFHENLPSKASVRLIQLSTLDSTCKVSDEESLKANGFHNSFVTSSGKTMTMKKKRKKLNFSCLCPSFVRD